MSAKFQIETDGVTFADKSRSALKEQFDLIRSQPGRYDVSITPAKEGYSPSRYKYYHDCILWQILNEAGNHYLIINPSDGEQRKPRNTAELHECVKAIYNPVILTVNGKSRVIAGTTTDLNNREFIGQFLQQIIADHSGPPYLIEFISYEDWKGLHRVNAWGNFKKTYKPQI
jgi:hypothetical protein